MSNTRSLRNRSSRFSSPATFTAINQGEATPPVQETIEVAQLGNGAQSQSRLDNWAEPAVRHGVASFEDTKGLERVGVLEHMQPLGIAPNHRILQKLKMNFNRSSTSARATPVYSEGVASPSVEPAKDEVASPIIDPELLLDAPISPPAPPLYSQPTTQAPTQTRMSSQVQEPSSPIITSPPRGRPAKKEVEEMRVYPGPDDTIVSPAMTSSISRASRASPRNLSVQAHHQGDRFRGSIQNAINRALGEGKYDVAAGLQRVLVEAHRDELATALDNISRYKGSVRIEQFKVFKHYVKKGVRKHRRDSTSAAQLDNDQAPRPSLRSQPVAYVSSFHANARRPSPLPSDSAINNNNNGDVLCPDARPDTHFDLSVSNTNTNTLPKLVLRSPIVTRNPVSDLPSDLPLNLPAGPSPRKRRSSSLSSLSSVMSIPSDFSPPPEVMNQNHGADARPVRMAAQRQAPTRAAANRPTRLSGMDLQTHQPLSDSTLPAASGITSSSAVPSQVESGHKHKRQKFTEPPVLDYDPEEIEAQRRNFENGIVPNYNYRKFPNIQERYPVERLNHVNPQTRPSSYRRPPPPVIHPQPLVATAEISSPASQQDDFLTLNGTGQKRTYEQYVGDDDSELSSPAPSFSSQPPPQPVHIRLSTANSSTRALTPRTARLGHLPNGRRQPRIMISPRKPRNGVSAPGAARAGISRDAAIINGVEERPENDDDCRACGDEGLLLLCEGCPNSFHGGCLEPPIDPATVEGEWYCPECERKGRPAEVRVDYFMSELIDNIADAYPKAYNLPHEIRNYFEYVKTGEEGEYVELSVPVTNKKGAPRADNNGALKAPDYKAVRDNKGIVRFCYKCGGTTDGEREMIPCDYCPFEWHLDCLTPPSATIPKRFNTGGKPIQPWRCPLHVDDLLIDIGRAPGALPYETGRMPRLRRPRNAKPVEANLPRPRFANNGMVDIQLAPENVQLNIKEIDMAGSITRLPELDVKLDFISKACRDFYNDITIPASNGRRPSKYHTSYLPDKPRFIRYSAPQTWSEDEQLRYDEPDEHNLDYRIIASQEAQLRLRQKSFVEQQTVLSLTEMANGDLRSDDNTNNSEDASLSIDGLINQLIADAPAAAVEKIGISEQEQLERLMKLVQQRLDVVKGQVQDGTKESSTLGQYQRHGKKLPEQQESITAGKVSVNGTLGHDHGE